MKRWTLLFILPISLMLGTLLTLPRAVAAAGCPYVYQVQPGDTVSEIAYRVGTNSQALAHFNRIRNVNYIYVGQLLCLPRPLVSPPSEPASVVHSSFDLVVQYAFTSAAENGSQNWTVGRDGQAGLRLSYPIITGDSIDTWSSPAQVSEASIDSDSPILWLARNGDDITYTLVVIGNPQPLLDLPLGFTRTITDLLPNLPTPEAIEEALENGTTDLLTNTQTPIADLIPSEIGEITSLRGELVGRDGTYVPLTIDQFDYQSNLDLAGSRYPSLGFALHSTDNPARNGYKIIMVLNDNGIIGPPGSGWRAHCNNWRGGGWWSRFRRAWYGC